MENQNNNPLLSKQHKDRKLIVQFIINQVENGTGLSIKELKSKYSEERFFYESLRYVTTTKKTLCKALDINIDNACRYKRNLEKDFKLVQSSDEVVCPYTGQMAHLLSTNVNEFERLKKASISNQLNLF